MNVTLIRDLLRGFLSLDDVPTTSVIEDLWYAIWPNDGSIMMKISSLLSMVAIVFGTGGWVWYMCKLISATRNNNELSEILMILVYCATFTLISYAGFLARTDMFRIRCYKRANIKVPKSKRG